MGRITTKDQGSSKKSPRLEGYDYSISGSYFITIVANEFKTRFGNLEQGRVALSDEGEIVRDQWFRSSSLRRGIDLFAYKFVVMPNHIHGIVWIEEIDAGGIGTSTNRAKQPEEGLVAGPKPRSLSAFISGYKASVTRRINILQSSPGRPVWKRNYHDRIIRNERELAAIRTYIQEIPLKWELDRHYTEEIL